MVIITGDPLSLDKAWNHVIRADCGAVCIFTGTVRNHHDGKKVVSLKYTSFDEMARKEIETVLREASEKWALGETYVAHRVGELIPTDVSVLVAVSSAHRKEAFAAGRYVIDELKKRAPIWKEEFYETGKAWISCSE